MIPFMFVCAGAATYLRVQLRHLQVELVQVFVYECDQCLTKNKQGKVNNAGVTHTRHSGSMTDNNCIGAAAQIPQLFNATAALD